MKLVTLRIPLMENKLGLLVLFSLISYSLAFSISQDALTDLLSQNEDEWTDGAPYQAPEEEPAESDSDLMTAIKRYYRGWGHRSRFPWKRLPDNICYRQPCLSNKHCCYRWNLCDKSAKVCTDCWYGTACISEADCCSKNPFCARVWRKHRDGTRYIHGGKCVPKL